MPYPRLVLPAPATSSSPVTKSFPYLAISLPPYFFSSNSFPCHRSEKSPAKSNHCHTSKIAKNNPCSCHTSEPPLGYILSTQIPDGRPRSVFLLPSRDEKPVTANPSLSALTNSDTRKSFRIRFYENRRVCTAQSQSGTHPLVEHSPFFSIACAMPILQLLYFDGLPSDGGVEGCYC